MGFKAQQSAPRGGGAFLQVRDAASFATVIPTALPACPKVTAEAAEAAGETAIAFRSQLRRSAPGWPYRQRGCGCAVSIGGSGRAEAERAQRLSAELRANLRRRKAQARARQHDAAGEHGVDSPAPGSAKRPAAD